MTSPAEIQRKLIQRVSVGDSLTRTAARRPGALALADGPRRLTYAQFSAVVNRFVIVVSELPKTSTGKVQKNLLRDRHAGHYTGTGR